jgi:hypothetical protein
MQTLGRAFAWMVLAALVVIALDRALTQAPLSSTRLALDGFVGATIALLVLRLARPDRRSH